MIRGYSYRYAFIVGAGCLSLLINIVAYGAPPHKSVVPGKSTSQPVSLEDQIRRQQAAAWTAFYTGKYEDAIKLADPLLKAPKDWARVEAAHCQARCFWSAGTKASMAKAQQLWTAMDKAATLNAHQERMTLAKSLGLEAKGQDPYGQAAQAVELLEGIVRKKLTDTCTAEAAIELARLYVKTKKFDEAKETLNFAVAFLQKEAKVELSPIASEPFIKVAAAAIAHLPYDQDPGREQFEKADALREARKYMDAMKAYQAIMKDKDFAKTDYAPRSEMSIGYCWQGLKQPAQAVEHWKKFIAAGSSSSWRGQAFTGLLDLCLEETLDLTEANKWAELAGVSIEAGLNNETSEPSWKKCVLDIYLRCGLVAFLMEKNRTAVEAFEEARKVARSEPRPEGSGLSAGASDDSTGIVGGLDRLIAAAKANKPVTPDEVHDSKADVSGRSAAKPDKKVALLCAMGTIYNCTEQYKRAESTFSHVVKLDFDSAGKVKSSKGQYGSAASAAQYAYAIFGQGAALDGLSKLSQAKEALSAAIKAFPEGSWHDETLYRLASTIQRQAESQFGEKTAVLAANLAVKSTSRPATMPSSEGVRKQRLISLATAMAEALPYWQELLKRYPQSRRSEQAMYNSGLIGYRLAVVTVDPAKAEQYAKDAVNSFQKMVQAFSGSPLAGEAFVRLYDVALEYLYDLGLAQKHIPASVAWAKRFSQEEDAAPEFGKAWERFDRRLTRDDLTACVYLIYLRNGLMCYLAQQYPDALKMFEAAKPFAPRQKYTIAFGTVPTAIEFLAGAAKSPKPLVPSEALVGEAKVQLVLQLGSLYYCARDYARSEELFNRVLDGLRVPVTAEQKSWALYMRARNRYALPVSDRDNDAVLADYTASAKAAPNSPWAYRSTFFAANLQFNEKSSPDQAVELWREVLRKYPHSPEAHRCAYYIGVAYEVNKKPKEAKEAFNAFLRDFPESPFVSLVRDYHLKNIENMEKQPTSEPTHKGV